MTTKSEGPVPFANAPGEERVRRVWNPNVDDLHEYIEKLERENSVLLTRLREVEGERDAWIERFTRLSAECMDDARKLAQAEQRVAECERALTKIAGGSDNHWCREVAMNVLTPLRALTPPQPAPRGDSL